MQSHELGFSLTNKWRTIMSWVHETRLHGRRGKTENNGFILLAIKIKASTQMESWPSSCVAPAVASIYYTESCSLMSRINAMTKNRNKKHGISWLYFGIPESLSLSLAFGLFWTIMLKISARSSVSPLPKLLTRTQCIYYYYCSMYLTSPAFTICIP